MDATHSEGDSLARRGGAVPGHETVPAYTLDCPRSSRIPVLIAVPHGGRAYPPALIEAMRDPAAVALKLEDRFVDLLARRVARQTGAALLIANAPRAMIDLNRAPDDMDWTMLAGRSDAVGERRRSPQVARRARSGLGLVPRRLIGHGELWKRPLEPAELQARIASVYEPYHSALAAMMHRLQRRWGAALLVDLHSMPPLTGRGGAPGAEFVLGDRFGGSCDWALVESAFAFWEAHKRRAAHNRPYAGGYVLDRHGRPLAGRHAMQIEVCRRTYLDGHLADLGERIEETARMIAGLVRRLADETAALGSAARFAAAAE